MQHRRSALAALSVLVALLAAACTGAVAAGESPPPRTAGSGSIPAERRTSPPQEDHDAPRWQLSPPWAAHPELLMGSRRFRELARPARAASDEPTNVVLITTDDMASSELRWMPKTRALIGAPGTRFTDSISPHPLCCPARAITLTGQFAQNNGVRTNAWPTGGYYKLDHSNTLPVWMKAAGYQTAFLGKYLNEYGRFGRAREVPPGWDAWRAPVGNGNYDYYNFQVNDDGELRDLDGTYQTDYYVEESEDLIRDMSGEDRPFFIWQSHLAPHTACPTTNTGEECWQLPTPSMSYDGVFDQTTPPQRGKPSYDEPDVSDKPHFVSREKPMSPADRRYYTELFQRRIESLQSVDDAVARTVAALDEAGELDNTLLLFTSDNGYLMGEHRIGGKIVGYEPSLRVPLLMRGPSVPVGVRRSETVATVDLAPTIAAAAGATPGLRVDGRDLQPVAAGTSPGWDTILIQGGPKAKGVKGWWYRGVRTDRYTFMSYEKSGEVELYDRRRDPFQLRNVAADPAYSAVRAELQDRLIRLGDCAGADCRQRFGAVPAPSR
ncbi:MAG TPA: sulfatase [Nocardioidaceae bacterium]|nr:sulfatase [Nocardioidaceae bacterium]